MANVILSSSDILLGIKISTLYMKYFFKKPERIRAKFLSIIIIIIYFYNYCHYPYPYYYYYYLLTYLLTYYYYYYYYYYLLLVMVTGLSGVRFV